MENHQPQSQLSEALDDLDFADALLRRACRIDEVDDRNRPVTSNLDHIAFARQRIDEGHRAIRHLMHDGRTPSDALVTRCAEILGAALGPAYPFIHLDLWNLRRSRPHSELLIAAGSRHY
jgi:hypothetical protein